MGSQRLDASTLDVPFNRRSAMVDICALFGAAGLPIYCAYVYAAETSPTWMLQAAALLWLFCIAALVASRFGKPGLASFLLVGAAWSTVAFVTMAEGAGTPHVGGFMPVIVLCGLLLNAWLALGMTAASCAIVLTAFRLENLGTYGPPPSPPTEIAAVLTHVVSTGGMTVALVYGFSSALRYLENRSREIAIEHARFAAMVQAAADGIVVVGPRREIVAANPAFSVLVERTEAELLGKPLHLFVREGDDQLGLSDLIAGNERELQLLFMRDSQPRATRVTAAPLSGDGPGVMLLTIRDITQIQAAEKQRQTLERRLRQATKMEAFGQLAGGVAHDFNNVLTAIFGSASLIRLQLQKGNLRDPKGLLTEITELEGAAQRGALMTRQLLAFSREDATPPEPVSPSRELKRFKAMLRRLVREDIDVSINGESSGQVVMAPGAVEQIVMNLAVNASDAMPRGGKLTISVGSALLEAPRKITTGTLPAGSYCTIRVTDTGEGMTEEVAAQVFEPFFTMKDVDEGTGLGLATVLGIAQSASGGVDLQTKPDEGSTFTVYLVHTSDEDLTSSVPPARISEAPHSGQSVLVCEDSEPILAMMARALKSNGYRVLSFSDPVAALDEIRRKNERIELLVTDVVMPRMNGAELYSALVSFVPDVKVLFVSGYTAGLIREQGLHDNVELLRKPFSTTDLLTRVAQVLGTLPRDVDSIPQPRTPHIES